MNKSPNEGGCWFCHTDPVEEVMFFSVEFDCYFHKHCLDKALAEAYNPEAEIIADEFNIPYVSKEPTDITDCEEIERFTIQEGEQL